LFGIFLATHCVRRTSLCDEGCFSGLNFDHRRCWRLQFAGATVYDLDLPVILMLAGEQIR